MDELITWLRAQLDDDERVARKCAPGPWVTQGEVRETYVVSSAGIAVATGWLRDAEHIARWDPKRVLAEIEAKRGILDELDSMITGWTYEETKDFGRDILKTLALPYAGRDGWREEWRP